MVCFWTFLICLFIPWEVRTWFDLHWWAGWFLNHQQEEHSNYSMKVSPAIMGPKFLSEPAKKKTHSLLFGSLVTIWSLYILGMHGLKIHGDFLLTIGILGDGVACFILVPQPWQFQCRTDSVHIGKPSKTWFITDFAHVPWEDTPNFSKPPETKKFLHKLLVKRLVIPHHIRSCWPPFSTTKNAKKMTQLGLHPPSKIQWFYHVTSHHAHPPCLEDHTS